MKTLDRDLKSIQEARDLIEKAKNDQRILARMNQDQIDKICEAICKCGIENSKELAKMAIDETGFGIYEDKIIKNIFASKTVFEYIKNMKTVGIINNDKCNKVVEVAVPVGIIAALIPSTNPTSTVIYKALISLKSANSIIFSPHPGAKKCIVETVSRIKEAAVEAGMPSECINVMNTLTIEGTNELMKHKDVSLILATGGEAMVKAAYSSGNPAIGVGPGNGPAFIEKSADIHLAVKRIISSKTFDNGTICASEQSIIVEKEIEKLTIEELKNQGAYFLDDEEKEKIEKFILRSNGSMNPKIVGKSVQHIADMVGLDIPKETKVILARESMVGKNIPLSREKLCPILAYYVELDWESACEKCIEILNNEGVGHTLMIHSQNEDIIKEFALKKPVSRILINTPGSIGGIGGSTNIPPSLTLGCGAVGGSSTSDNVTPMNLINIRRVAYGVRELEDIRECAEFMNENKKKDICLEDKEFEQFSEYITQKVFEKLGI
ncbi:acetaldehyde dehydrogenase (acetylating) [Tepidibacter sp. Z1-5]|uniref:acetaldehyde dehydrogenase (acetylating) n=1 Tax=Tepidibacter sp. Z1-5 TaxID=3134138 RepID=UPI0030BE7EB3